MNQDPASPEVQRPLELPTEIGPFRILRKIGEGGMGIVFLAQQEHPTRMVALKVIHAGALSPRTLRRFEQEGEVLARLQHPGIAQIYQAGTYDSGQGVLPYIAMEYVEGERLDAVATRGLLPIRARLELASKIADAVEHAHQKGVIHRDLKPGNIIVTHEGQPKILDFGVARLVDDETHTTTLRTDMGAMLGTLPYMSPEQASGDQRAIDARSDVYSLGVVIYELLSTKLPHDLGRFALSEAVRIIREDEPDKLSTHDRTLRGDIETIVQKALEKDRTRRYPSARALADDIRRHLADEPIHARPPSAWYQLSKFTRRNKVLVGGVAAVLLTLTVGVAVATRLYLLERDANVREREANNRERQARVQAEAQQKHAEATSAFLLAMFRGIDPNVAQGADTTLLQRILDDARKRLSTELADQPEIEAQLRSTLGNAYLQLNLFDASRAELERARELQLTLFGADDRRTLSTWVDLAQLLSRCGKLKDAEALTRETLERQERVLGPTDHDTLATKRELGSCLMREGRYREAESTLREVIGEQEKLPESERVSLLATKMILAQTLNYVGRSGEAREFLEQVLTERHERLGDDHPDTIVAQASLASTLTSLDLYDDAEAAQRDALARAQRVFGPDNQQTLSILNNLAECLQAMGRLDEAEATLRDCLARRQRALGEDHLETLGTFNNLGTMLWSQGRYDEAGPLILQAFETMRRVLGEDSRQTMQARFLVARVLSREHRPREAAEQLEKIAASARERLPEDNPDRASSLYNWAAMLQDAGDDDAAEPVLRECLDLVERHFLQTQEFVPAAQNALAKVLEHRGEHASADVLYRTALDTRRQKYGTVHAEVAYSLSDYGEALLRRGDLAAAEPLCAELVRVQTLLSPKNDWRLASAQQLQGRCLARLGRYAEAEALLLQACEALSQLPDALPAAARQAREGILALYAAWEAAEPGQGIGQQAERWRAKFPAED